MLDSALDSHAIHREFWWLPPSKNIAETGELFNKHFTKMIP